MPPSPAPTPTDGPPPEEFWQKYNGRSEFPLSATLTVLIHVAAAVVIVAMLYQLMKQGDDKAPVDVTVVSLADGGLDDIGSASGGGIPSPAVEAQDTPLEHGPDTVAPVVIPEVRQDLEREVQVFDPTSRIPIAAPNVQPWASLDKALRDKALGGNRPNGGGDPAGPGGPAAGGAGSGGTGPDSTRSRSLRWVLKFPLSSMKDYMDQLAAMKAVVLVPNAKGDGWLVFDDPTKPGSGRASTPDDDAKVAGCVKFVDDRPDGVANLARFLTLDYRPRSFMVVFPKDVETTLAEKERAYRNRESKDIDETIFQVTVTGGQYSIRVYEQTARR